MPNSKTLSSEEIQTGLSSLEGWSVEGEGTGGKLHKEFRFKDFSQAFGFMTRVALIAETLGHHPEWCNVYNRVTLDLTTHDAGGITQKDLEFASRVEGLS